MSGPGPALALLLALAAAVPSGAQKVAHAADSAARRPRAPRVTHFFDSEEPLALTITTNIGRVRRDRGVTAPWRAATLRYASPAGAPVDVPIRVRTRGIWRLKSCAFPPLRLDFGRRAAKDTPFAGLDRPKLVNYCQDSDEYEQYVLQELQLYRVLALLTPASHRVRLVRMTYADSATGRAHATRWAFMMEEPEAVAARLGGSVIAEKGADADVLDPYHAVLVGVFQYLIGNGDWSASQLHNAEIVRDSTFELVLVPYDYDFSGAVNARYATPDPNTNVKSVRERIYRGYCAPTDVYAKVFALFGEKRAAIYGLYADSIGRRLRPEVAAETLRYFDDFYRTIGSPAAARREILEACTGHR